MTLNPHTKFERNRPSRFRDAEAQCGGVSTRAHVQRYLTRVVSLRNTLFYVTELYRIFCRVGKCVCAFSAWGGDDARCTERYVGGGGRGGGALAVVESLGHSYITGDPADGGTHLSDPPTCPRRYCGPPPTATAPRPTLPYCPPAPASAPSPVASEADRPPLPTHPHVPVMLLPLLVLTTAASAVMAHDRPIIGVLAQTADSEMNGYFPELNYTSYVQASYVQFVEAAGARVAPVFIHRPDQYYVDMFNQLNGLVLPGGKSILGSASPFGSAARAFWDLAHAHPERYFPIWGTCLGHEELAVLAGGYLVIEHCDAENMLVTVQPEPALAESRMFANATAEQLALFTEQPNLGMFHSNCVRPEGLSSRAGELLSLATTQDRSGATYVAILEHRTLPIYGTQFHPEKPAFEWSTLERVDQIPHTPEAVLAGQYLGNFFVSEARRSDNVFASEAEEEAALIYNHIPYFTGSKGSSFEMCYFFDDSDFL